MSAKFCGFDINGYCDFFSKNWDNSIHLEEKIDKVFVSGGDLFSSVVKARTISGERWVGGKQAQLAPHGRGPGWGDIGNEKLRIKTRELVSTALREPDAYAGLFQSYSSEGKINIIAVDEGEPEEKQEILLESASIAKISNPLIVWRSVLSSIYAIKQKLITSECKLGIINHSRDGFTLQILQIVSPLNDKDGLLVPERKMTGSVCHSDFGFSNLERLATDEVLTGQPINPRNRHLTSAISIGKLALGEPTSPEMLRLSNGNWEELLPSASLKFEIIKMLGDDFDELNECDCVLLESIASDKLKQIIFSKLEKEISSKIIKLPRNSVALGALEAADRISRGDPVYFDFLPQISTVVFKNGVSKDYKLIRNGERVEAGKLYRSPEPAQLAMPSGQKKLNVYIAKEGNQFPKKFQIKLPKELSKAIPVEVFVEQKPVAGKANIFIEAKEIGQRYFLNWDEGVEIEKSWEELISSLEGDITSYPTRLVLNCGKNVWEETQRNLSFYDLIEANKDKEHVDWMALAKKASERHLGNYCISSEGKVPDGINTEIIEHLDELYLRALTINKERVAKKLNTNNDSLRFLTWQFKRCPSALSELLFDCIKIDINGRDTHPFIQHSASRVLVYQGLARVSNDAELEKDFLHLISKKHVKNWNWRVETASVAILLSRSNFAPEYLTRDLFENFFRRVEMEFKDNLNGEYTKFNYTPFLLAGLLRFREIEPMSLLINADPLAEKALGLINDALKDLKVRSSKSSKGAFAHSRYSTILNDLKDYIEGKGNNPELLLDIYNV